WPPAFRACRSLILASALDERRRAQAAHLDAHEPGWLVLYGPWSRAFFAFAAWPAPRALIVGARTPEALRDAMRHAETAAAVAGRVPHRAGRAEGSASVSPPGRGCRAFPSLLAMSW